MTTSNFGHSGSPGDAATAAPASLRWSNRESGTGGEAGGWRPTGRLGHPDALRDRLAGASDVALAEALCAHVVAALDEAFRRHATRVALTVRAIAGAYYIDDVVQDVFLELWREPQRFDPERGSLASYLVVAARGRTLDRVRSDGAWHRRHRNHNPQPTPVGDVADAVVAEVSAAKLRLALRALPMNERVAIELAYFGGQSYRQVAVTLGLPEGTVKGRIRSGLRRLEAALSGIGVQERD